MIFSLFISNFSTAKAVVIKTRFCKYLLASKSSTFRSTNNLYAHCCKFGISTSLFYKQVSMKNVFWFFKSSIFPIVKLEN